MAARVPSGPMSGGSRATGTPCAGPSCAFILPRSRATCWWPDCTARSRRRCSSRAGSSIASTPRPPDASAPCRPTASPTARVRTPAEWISTATSRPRSRARARRAAIRRASTRAARPGQSHQRLLDGLGPALGAGERGAGRTHRAARAGARARPARAARARADHRGCSDAIARKLAEAAQMRVDGRARLARARRPAGLAGRRRRALHHLRGRARRAARSLRRHFCPAVAFVRRRPATSPD